MLNPQSEYQFLESTISLCNECLRRIDAKIILKEGKVFVLKNCLKHGEQEELLEEDAEYYQRRMIYNKAGTKCKTQTPRRYGCPLDCGLCPEHEQHTCIGLIEVTTHCNIKCPVCYASSGIGKALPLEKIEKMLDFFVDSEYGNAEILQISGGEPTTHPQIIEIIKMAREKGIAYVLLNTNGLRIARDENFVKELSQFKGGFEIYLQFDGFDEKVYRQLRGMDFCELKKRAIENLTKYEIPITLVTTVQRGLNEKEIGKIVEYGINTKYIRGINFQPVALFGRLEEVDRKQRITITGIMDCIEKQTKGMLKKSDFIPLPCNVDRVAITYLYRHDDEFMPLMRDLHVKDFLPAIRNTFKFNPEEFLKDLTKSAFSKESCCNYLDVLKQFRKIIPKSYLLKSKEKKREFISENVFRISITSFIDAYNFDMKSMKKECVHVITPELKKIPFSSFNMLYRPKNAD